MTRSASGSRQRALKLLLAPALVFMVAFFVAPLIILLRYSFADFEGGEIGTTISFANYLSLVQDPLYRQIIVRTLAIAAVTTTLCIILGYPIAWGIVRAHARWRPILLVLVLTPLLIGGVIRCYGWLLLLDERGLVNNFLLAIGVVESPVPLLFGFWSVVITMVEVLLPFFVLPMLGTLSSIDPLLEKASLSLGATRFETFFKIIFPLSLPGVIAGGSIVFSLALTIFVVPRIIGGPSYLMLATLAYQQVGEVGNLPFGSAVAALMLVLTLIVLFIVSWFAPARSPVQGGG
jgi:putative spermidine/putrescine transport system permease protein